MIKSPGVNARALCGESPVSLGPLKLDYCGFSGASLWSFLATSSLLWAALEPLGRMLEGRLEGLLGLLRGRLLGASWTVFGVSWGRWSLLEGLSGPSGPSWGFLGAVLGQSWANPGPSWSSLAPS